jgi:hypothetical protein
MRSRVLLAAAAAATISLSVSSTSTSAAVRIVSDYGGQIGPYLEQFAALRHSGERVIIDGPCLSACTMLLGMIPRDRICVTRRARLGFHAAWNPGQNGAPIVSSGGTQLLMEVYPQHVRQWIARQGGLTQRMVFLAGRELASMYRTCR